MRQRCDNCVNWKTSANSADGWGVCPIGEFASHLVATQNIETSGDFGCRFWDRKPASLPHKRKGPVLFEHRKAEIIEEFLKTGSLYKTAINLGSSRATIRRYVIAAGYGHMIYSSWQPRLRQPIPSRI